MVSPRSVWEKPMGSQDKPQQCLGELVGHRAGVSPQRSPLTTGGSFKAGNIQ